MASLGEAAGYLPTLSCHRIEGEQASFYAVVFPDPNNRAALWADDGTGGVTIYNGIEDALESIGADDYHRANVSDVRPFAMRRYEDVNGCSGTGVPAVGMEFPDGTCAMGWLTDTNSVSIYGCLKEVRDIHGHGGKTRFVYTDTRA